MDKGGKMILRENLGGPQEKFLNFRPSETLLVHFSNHLWFSNDMMGWP